MNDKICVVFPTRERVSLLQNCIHSFRHLTARNVEIDLIADNDDPTDYSEFIKDFGNINVRLFKREHSNNFNRDYRNWVTPQLEFDYFMIGTDDMQMVTKDWDEIVRNTFKISNWGKDHIMYGVTHSDDHGICSFPVVTKEAVDALDGKLMNEMMPGWGADGELYKVFAENSRVCDLDVFIKHISPQSGTRPKDKIDLATEENNQVDPTYPHLTELRFNIIKKAIFDPWLK